MASGYKITSDVWIVGETKGGVILDFSAGNKNLQSAGFGVTPFGSASSAGLIRTTSRSMTISQIGYSISWSGVLQAGDYIRIGDDYHKINVVGSSTLSIFEPIGMSSGTDMGFIAPLASNFVRGFHVYNCTIKYDGYAIKFNYGDSVLFENVIFDGGNRGGTAVLLGNASDVVFRRCTFIGGGSQVDTNGSCYKILFDECLFISGEIGIDVSGMFRTSIRGCNFSQQLLGGCIYNAKSDVTIIGCNFTQCSDGIAYKYGDSISVIGCTFYGCFCGFNNQGGAHYANISGNKFISDVNYTTYHGINTQVGGANQASIIGNYFYGVNIGVEIAAAVTKAKIMGNTFNSNIVTAPIVDNGTGTIILGNDD
jgi:hypothetical protein